MNKIQITAFDLAQRFVGLKEIPGAQNESQVMAMLRLDQKWPGSDEVPWCSAFVNYIAWMLRLPRSKNLAARSWLLVGRPISLELAEAGFDVVVLKRGTGNQPGPEIIGAPGHVGFYAGHYGEIVQILGGNQSNSVCLGEYNISRILGIRRLLD